MKEMSNVINPNTGIKGIMSTNSWITSEVFADSLKNHYQRGKESGFYYNMYLKIFGVNDKYNFFNNLVVWQLKLKSKKRTVFLLENKIEKPSFTEIQTIGKIQATTKENLIKELSQKIQITNLPELEKLLKRAFVDVLSSTEEIVSIIKNRGIMLLCWINRYIPELFKDEPLYDYPTFIYYGSCHNKNEKTFLMLLSRIPVDVFLVCPDRSLPCDLADEKLFELDLPFSLELEPLSKNMRSMKFSTTASAAQKELEEILYNDTGLFKVHQFKTTFPIVLETIYEEIKILWNQEAQFRQGFEILNNRVITPVICSKISGVPSKNLNHYWESIEYFLQNNCYFIRGLPHITGPQNIQFSKSVINFIKEKKILVDKIKNHPSYKYKFLRREIQDLIFDRAQALLDSGIIVGTYSQGIEYLILNTIFGLDSKILRMIQDYDFTQKIPKLVIVNTTEEIGSKEDAVLVAFLNLIGFDILLFVPTGYLNIGAHFTKKVFIEHNIGSYVHDLEIPTFDEEKREFNLSKSIISLFWRR